MPSISCIIVNYNKEAFLRQAILSVINQTMPVAEVIVADDASTDGSRELITALAHEYSQIKPIFREKNLGVGANRDLAIRAAESELITYLDGDDWYSPQKIEKEFLAQQGYADAIAYSDIQVVRHENELIWYWDTSGFPNHDVKQRLQWLVTLPGPAPRDMLVPKKLYLEAGGIQHGKNLHEDWDYQLRLAAYPNPWVHSGIVGVNYRLTDSGLAKTNSLSAHVQAQARILMSNHKLLTEQIGVHNFWWAMAQVYWRGTRSALGIRSKLRKIKTYLSSDKI
ncbi:MAG: glycosyltransferase family 2 protein [Coleofasciculus sp. G1-WW12-02]|uniref:glycosyltransferase family 2 protein n=1 Tax=Coleofasciculus sp. G1-WW12-02 TaxID=3068483 RepID=UPI0032F2C312